MPLPPARRFYLASVALVTLFCLAIPVFYLGLVAGVAWLLIAWYLHWVPPLLGSGWPIMLVLLSWALPAVMGPVLLAFLLKPLVAPRARPAPRRTLLRRYEEPQFFAAVEELCAALGVAAPVAIVLDERANASVSYEHGLHGLLRGRRMLTLGMPLVAAMSARQFVGVLAHEFGHFAQRGAGAGGYLINRINGWLYSRAHGHDRWDERLDAWMDEDANHYVVLLAGLTRLALAGVRGLLRGLFELSFRVSRRLSRDMEFDADRYEAAIAGSACFRATSLRLRAVHRALEDTHRANAGLWREGRLVDDLPSAAQERLRQFTPQDWQALIEEMQGDWETHYWDSHPPDSDRIEAAERSAMPGLFLDERPARLLFKDAAALFRRTTLDHYAALGVKVDTQQLVGAEDFGQRRQHERTLDDALARYGNGLLDAGHPPSPREAAQGLVAGLAWQAAVDELRRLGPRASGLWQRIERRRERADEAEFQLVLLEAGAEVLDARGQPCDPAALRLELQALRAEDDDGKLARLLGALAARRFSCAAQSLQGDARALAETRLRLLQHLADLWPRCEALARRRVLLLRADDWFGEGAGAARRRDERLHAFANELAAFFLRAEAVALPGHDTLAAHLRARSGERRPGGEAVAPLAAAAGLAAAFLRLQRTCLGELALQAMQAEQAAGIRPIRLLPA